MSDSLHRRSALSWILIIACGILLGNALTLGGLILAQRYGYAEAIAELSRLLPASPATPEEQREADLQQRLDANCRYWEEQVDRADTAQNRAFRDMACARAKGMYR